MAKVKVTFVLPGSLQKELKSRIITDGYNQKSKSLWVSEAIQTLLVLPNYPDLVQLNDAMTGFEKLESVILLNELKRQVDDAVLNIRQKFPSIEGVQSRILRTAIVQRLIRSNKLSHLTYL